MNLNAASPSLVIRLDDVRGLSNRLAAVWDLHEEDQARYLSLNGPDNARRWQGLYGNGQQILIVPTGCPERIPPPRVNPFPSNRRIVLFCGSLTAPRFASVLNATARRLRQADPGVEVHFLGRNRLHLYGAEECLDPSVVQVHEAVEEGEAWQYILHAHVGLALAPSHEVFESELAKIYYYLRGGLPVVTESAVLNRHLIEETGYGAIARYGDDVDLVSKILSTLELRPRDQAVMRYMAETHSWGQRAAVYADLFRGRNVRQVR